MVIVLFRSRLRDDAGEEYTETSQRMLALARETPGFVSFKTFSASDGERLSLIEFESDEAAAAWGGNADHRKAQALGREQFYSEYRLQICEPVREYGWKLKK